MARDLATAFVEQIGPTSESRLFASLEQPSLLSFPSRIGIQTQPEK
jgi:hypothetical protein